MQIKDKVLDGVGKHFVAHGCFVLVACGGRKQKDVPRTDGYFSLFLFKAPTTYFQKACTEFTNANTSLVYSYGTS